MVRSFQYFEEEYSLDDFTEASDTSLTDDEYRTVERLEVEKGEAVAPGQGSAKNQTDAIGRLYYDAQDGDDDDITGKVRFVVLNSQNRVVHVISQHQLNTLTSGETDRSARRPYAFRRMEVTEPHKLGIQIKTSSGTATYDSSNSTLNLDGFRGEAVA